MKNTPENKAQFFALYWGQEIMRWHQWLKSTKSSIIDFKIPMQSEVGIDKGWYLELRSVKKMLEKDSDDFNMAFTYDINQYGYTRSKERIDWKASHIDELRRRGYAVPWMGLSVEKLIEYGWIKLIE